MFPFCFHLRPLEVAEFAETQIGKQLVNNTKLIPALDVVGKGFEKGTVFLPQLLMSAEAAKAAFDEVRKTMPAASSEGLAVILATVKGDINDTASRGCSRK